MSCCYRVHFGVDIIKLPGHGSSVMKRAPVVSSYEVTSFILQPGFYILFKLLSD